jgi:hypothetical protein
LQAHVNSVASARNPRARARRAQPAHILESNVTCKETAMLAQKYGHEMNEKN